MSARRQTENSAPGHHFYFFETQRVSGITRGLSGRAGGKSTDHRTPGNRVGRMSSQRGAGGNLANWEAGTLRFAPRGVGRVDAGPPLPGVPGWGALGRGPWPPPWPGGARPGCREGRDFAGCSPSARERMFHRESQPGCRRVHRGFIECAVASAHGRMIASGCDCGPDSGVKCRILAGSLLSESATHRCVFAPVFDCPGCSRCRSYARRSQSVVRVGCDRGLSNDFLDRFHLRLVDCDARLIKHGRPSDGRPPFV